jgi:single-strand DNA-binding protein
MSPVRGGAAIERKGSHGWRRQQGHPHRQPRSGSRGALHPGRSGESWTDKNGQKQERTEWHRIVVWGKLAELCGEYLKKGRQCYVEGRLQTREWTDKENRKNYTTEVVANSVVFLGGRDAGAGEGMGSRRGSGGSYSSRGGDDYGPPPPGLDDGMNQSGGNGDDDIPF